jgi:hypothetical protein
MAEPQPAIRYEDAAEYRTNIEGWCCRTCRRFWAADECMARWCCATELPCPECGGRNANKSYTCCTACLRRHEDGRWAKLERVEWDGETPLCDWRVDRYYFDADEAAEMIAEHLGEGGAIEDIRLVVCEPDPGRPFSMADFLEGHLPPDFDPGPEYDEIDGLVNAWIEARSPLCWRPGDRAVSVDSLRAIVGPMLAEEPSP